jgi:AcrR family transcriptional regulator
VPSASSTDDLVVEPAGRRGRPRRFAAAEELQLILHAAFEVTRRNGYQEATVGDILAEAGLSTRSFYRHFSSKDELLQAMFRGDAEQFAAAVTRRVERAPDPWDAAVVWIDEILGFGLGRPRARRAAMLGSPAAMRSLAPEELRRALTLLVAPLTAVLRAGKADESFDCVDPDTEAMLLSAMAWEASARIGDASSRAERDALRSVLLSFAGRALGRPR